MIIIKNIKTITIIDNDDYNKSQYIHISNIDGKGTEFEIKKGYVTMALLKNLCSDAIVDINIHCDRDKEGYIYEIREKEIIENISNNDLINELKKRNILSEEIVYKIKE